MTLMRREKMMDIACCIGPVGTDYDLLAEEFYPHEDDKRTQRNKLRTILKLVERKFGVFLIFDPVYRPKTVRVPEEFFRTVWEKRCWIYWEQVENNKGYADAVAAWEKELQERRQLCQTMKTSN